FSKDQRASRRMGGTPWRWWRDDKYLYSIRLWNQDICPGMGKWQIHHFDNLLYGGPRARADHFCDYKNEPHYAVKLSSTDPAILNFKFRYATNLGPHPIHFHSTTWRIVDNDHLI